VRFRAVFETATDRRSALRRWVGLGVDVLDQFPALDAFIRTFEVWQDEILNDFETGQTSGPVEGINNKARVVVKRAYGLKSADSLWTRLVLDLNRAKDVVGQTIGQIRALVTGFRAIFSSACT
jgi:transposase